MSLPSVVAISGSLAAPSRTRVLVDAITAAIERAHPAAVRTIDLANAGPLIAPLTGRKGIAPEAEAIFNAIETADLLVVGSPIYKASYTGLFKHLFDLIDPKALTGVPVILSATGGSDRHALALDHQFRPLFSFFNALTVPTAVYAVEAEIEKTGEIRNPDVEARAARGAAEALSLFATRTLVRVAA
jgi:FMN reductase